MPASVWRQAPEIFHRWLWAALVVGHAINFVLQLASAVGAAGNGAGIYVVGLLWWLVHAATQFGRILFAQPTAR